ncbi:lysophospholipid acyltransferase family protein [Bacillus sp. B190/17]|uniref:Lysophospholipid acyltransferase family protein n=1 Tax=Bacillus lumedeiriae TaxID=3058829 RepID=A0ABW8I4X4_9BACI
MTFYSIAKNTVKSILMPLYRIEVIGREHVPKEGGVLLCSNHISNLDPPVVGITSARPISFMAKEELFHAPVFGKMLKHLKAFPVKRGMSDREALRKGLQILKEGNVLGLFPEGTRSKTGEVGQGLSGAGFFALRTNAHVIPCAIIGPYKLFSKLKVVYGPPINMDELRSQKASIEETTEVIMSHIRKLKDEYR